jgi:hypothetical protein
MEKTFRMRPPFGCFQSKDSSELCPGVWSEGLRNADCIIGKENMYLLKYSFIALVAACLALGSGIALGGDESLQPSGNVSLQQYPSGRSIGSRPEAPSDIREDIRKAQEFLNHRQSGYTVTVERTTVLVTNRRGRTREKVVKKKRIEPVFLLAVEDLKEKNLRLVRFTGRGCETDGFDAIMTRNNGVGSRFEVRYPENMAVLALRTMVHSGEKGYKEVVYTPYCPEIDTWQVREDGLNYLKQQIESARMDLEERGVKLKDFRWTSRRPTLPSCFP